MRILKQGRRLKNGFMFLPIHYTHDREGGKDTYEWREAMRSSFPKPTDFDKEMEIDFGLHVGAPAYPFYSDVKHLSHGLPYDERRPLHLSFDFNTNPMSLIIDQEYREKRLIFIIREFVYGPTTIDNVILDFRNTYPSHKSDIRIYGDATKGTNAQTAKSNWDVVRFGFRGYHIVPSFLVPLANPHIGDRLNAVNRVLGPNGPIGVVIDADFCPEIVRDFREVIKTPDGKKIFKESDPDNPYYFRTHASDAWGYRIYSTYPTVSEVVSDLSKKREPIQAGRLMGEVDQGLKIEQQLRSQEIKMRSRKPMNRGGAV